MALVDIEFQEYNYNSNFAPHLVSPATTTTGKMVSLELTPLKLALCSAFCGYLNLRDYGTKSLQWHLGRLIRAKSCIGLDSARNRLVATPDYLNSDPTEKGQLSEILGMAMTYAVASEFFGVPWVCHTSRMKGRHQYELIPADPADMKPGFNPSGLGKEADLIGFECSGRPHFFEAKGTSSNSTDAKDRRKAINQASMSCGIKDANGNKMPFATRNACCFTFGGDFKGMVIDPPQNHADGYKAYPMGLCGTLFDDYASLFKALQTHETQRYFSDSIQFDGIAFDGEDGGRYVLGLEVGLVEVLHELRFDDYRRILRLDRGEGPLSSRQLRRAERLAEWNGEMAGQTYSVARFVGDQSPLYGSQDFANNITSSLKAKETVVGRDGIILIELA